MTSKRTSAATASGCRRKRRSARAHGPRERMDGVSPPTSPSPVVSALLMRVAPAAIVRVGRAVALDAADALAVAGDPVAAVRHDGVAARAAVDGVEAAAAHVDRVGAGAREHRVVECGARDQVVAARTRARDERAIDLPGAVEKAIA